MEQLYLSRVSSYTSERDVEEFKLAVRPIAPQNHTDETLTDFLLFFALIKFAKRRATDLRAVRKTLLLDMGYDLDCLPRTNKRKRDEYWHPLLCVTLRQAITSFINIVLIPEMRVEIDYSEIPVGDDAHDLSLVKWFFMQIPMELHYSAKHFLLPFIVPPLGRLLGWKYSEHRAAFIANEGEYDFEDFRETLRHACACDLEEYGDYSSEEEEEELDFDEVL